MEIDDCYKIGLIMKPHGLKGEVTISIDADIPNDFASLDAVFINYNDQLVPYFISSASVRGAKAFVKFEDIDTIEQAQTISKLALYLPKSARPKARHGEFYADEVLGFSIEDENYGELGTVREVVQAGLQRLLSVHHNDKVILIPVNDVFIKSVNRKKTKIIVSLPEGFLDM